MAPEVVSQSLADRPWFVEFLKSYEFQRIAPETFSNGRASLRLNGSTLFAIPSDPNRPWKSELRGASPESIRLLLSSILVAPSFLSQAEFERQATSRLSAETALEVISANIREQPDTPTGLRLRQFVWSLFNRHHALNLWQMKDALDNTQRPLVREVFCAWMEGLVSDSALRRALVESGEMDRWDTIRLRAPELSRLIEVVDSASDLVNLVPPGYPTSHLAPAIDLLQQALDLLQCPKPTASAASH